MKVAGLVILLTGQFEEVFVLLAVDCRGNSGRPHTCRGLCTIFLDLQFRVAKWKEGEKIGDEKKSLLPSSQSRLLCLQRVDTGATAGQEGRECAFAIPRYLVQRYLQ